MQAMGHHASRFEGDINQHVTNLLEQGIENCKARVVSQGGHFAIEVSSPVFEGMSMLNRQRAVYNALGDLMRGADAPIHAVDTMVFHTE